MPAGVAVVDRAGWIRGERGRVPVVLDPLAVHLREQGRAPDPGSVIASVGSRVTGMQAGLHRSPTWRAGCWASTRLFLPPDPETPRARRQRAASRWWRPTSSWWKRELGGGPARLPPLGLPARGAPHRTQFTSVDWLRGLRAGSDDAVPARLRPRPGDHSGPGARRRRCHGRGGGGAGDGDSLIEAIQTRASERSSTASPA